MAVRCARIDEEMAEKAITRIIQKLGYSQLKPEQLKVIMEFVCGKDVFAVLPTGFGKTLCYVCLPLVFDELTHRRASIAGIIDKNSATQTKNNSSA